MKAQLPSPTIILDLLDPTVEFNTSFTWSLQSFSDVDSDYLDILTLYPAYVAVANDDGSHLIKSFKFVFCSLEGTCIQ